MRKIPSDMVAGTIHETNNFGCVEILNYEHNRKVTVKFLNTNSVRVVRSDSIREGRLKDLLAKTVFGTGYLGGEKFKAKVKGKELKAHYVWKGMMARCYSPSSGERYPTYEGCSVCDEWHNYQTFAEWYTEKTKGMTGHYQIDKDLSCYGERGKLYSPDTCVIVSAQVNTEEAHSKHYKMRDPSGVIVSIYNMAKFCRDNGLSNSNMNGVYHGRTPSHRGWTKVN